MPDTAFYEALTGLRDPRTLREKDQDDSYTLSLILAVYGKDAAACDQMTEAEFWGLSQNLERVEKYRANTLASILLRPFLKTA